MVNSNIDIGDRVYIGGIYGDDFEVVNNKLGRIDSIVFASYQGYSTYLVDVIIDGQIFPINIGYVYKIDDLDTYDFEGILEEYPIGYFFNKFEIKGEAVISHYRGQNKNDLERGTTKIISKTKNNIAKIFYITSPN